MRNILLLALLLGSDTKACLNEFRIEHLEMIIDIDEKKFMLSTNNAVTLILKQEYELAIQKLVELEQAYPNRYETSTNLGTAYELIGDIDNALLWIKKGIELNPHSHDGTEWLHYKILEAKKKIENNPNFLVNSSIFDISNIDTYDGIKALTYQLEERTKLIQPPNKVIADLYFLQGLLHERDGNEILMRSSFSKSIGYGDLRKEQIIRKTSAEKPRISIEPTL